MTNKHIKIVQSGYENLTGPLGPYDFVDGVSTAPLPQATRDRLAAAFTMVEIEEDGSETPAGIAHRLVAQATMTQAVMPETQRQTEAEKLAEQKMLIEAKLSSNEGEAWSREQLEDVLSKKGISGLREIGDRFGVKSRKAVDLLNLILKAQAKGQDQRAERMAQAIREAEQELGQDTVEPTEPEKDGIVAKHVDVNEAAASGNLAAAIEQGDLFDNQETANDETDDEASKTTETDDEASQTTETEA